jgi:hypothetical protein
MPDFQPHVMDWAACRRQVQELQALLEGSADLAESAFRAFFEPRAQLRALVGHCNPHLGSPDRLAWQYPISGDFRCDFAVGDRERKVYTFVGLEGARPNSLFVKQGERATRAWSPRLGAVLPRQLRRGQEGGGVRPHPAAAQARSASAGTPATERVWRPPAGAGDKASGAA